jgi:hypothetical protein
MELWIYAVQYRRMVQISCLHYLAYHLMILCQKQRCGGDCMLNTGENGHGLLQFDLGVKPNKLELDHSRNNSA